MEVKFVQPEKPDKEVTLFGISIEVKPVQPSKASFSMLVTQLGISTDVKPMQLEKAPLPMLFTPLPNITDVNPVQP